VVEPSLDWSDLVDKVVEQSLVDFDLALYQDSYFWQTVGRTSFEDWHMCFDM